MRNKNETACLMEPPSDEKFNPKIFLENEYCLCDDFKKILKRSKKTSCLEVLFNYWDLKDLNINGSKSIKPFKFSDDLWLIHSLIIKQANGEKGKLVVDKLANIFPMKNKNGLLFFLFVCFNEGQWCFASYTYEEEIDYKIGFRIFEKYENDN